MNCNKRITMAGVTYFLIIGIEAYNDPANFRRVAYAKSDASEVRQVFLNIGYDPGDFVELLDKDATKTAIEGNLELISKKALPNDRIIIYFAGHGLAIGDKNFLVPADAIGGFLERTCISINTLLGIIKRSKSKRNILFLDCCHSGFEPGELERKGSHAFDSDRLLMEYRDEKYCTGFASCQSHQLSISDHVLKHGVWSYFLTKALGGTGEDKIYEEGCLFSDALQEYLRDSTSEFVTLNSHPKTDQTPVQFGYHTKKFIVEDLSHVFAALAAAKVSSGINVKAITLLLEYDYPLKDHPRFIKGKHFIPAEVNKTHDSFIRKISEPIVESMIDEMVVQIRKNFGYRLKQIKIERDFGIGTIVTPDFDYLVEVSQNRQAATEYSITRRVENFKDISIMEDAIFNELFNDSFTDLVFYLMDGIDVEEVIDKIESLPKGSSLGVDYSHNDLSRCDIKIEGQSGEIILETDAIALRLPYKSAPKELIASFMKVSELLLSRKIPLLLS